MATKKRMIYADDLMKAIRSFRWIGPPNTLKLMFEHLWLIIRDQPTVDAVPVSAEELRHLINDTLAYIWKMESDGRENLTESRKTLLEKLKRFEKEHFPEIACSYGERKDND